MKNYEGCDCGGEHRTLGGRAWCLDCHEYCYPENACEIADLRADVKRLTEELAKAEGWILHLEGGVE